MKLVTRAVNAWNHFWFEPGPAEALGICRVLFFGTLLLWMWTHDFAPWGAYSSVFWMPIWLFDTFRLPSLPAPTIDAMQAVWKAALFLSAIGLFTRVAMMVAFVLSVYLVGLPHNFGQTQHFDTLVVFACGALAVSRAADAWSLDAWLASLKHPSPWRRPDDGEYTWPIRFVWVAMAMIFFAAGYAKLRRSGLEWVFSDNLGLLLQRQQYHVSDGEPWTNWGLWIAQYPWMARSMAGIALATEALFPLVLISRYARLVLVPAGLLFLIGIRALMGPTFEQFMLCYIFWIPWHRLIAYRRESVATTRVGPDDTHGPVNSERDVHFVPGR